MDIEKKQQEQTAGDNATQNQIIGDNSSQIVVDTQVNTFNQTNVTVTGVPYSDIISLTTTVSAQATQQAVAMCTQVAEATVRTRMEAFKNVWEPRITGMENVVNNLIDPKFQFMIRDANITAAKSSRDEDLDMLAELLACHIEKGQNVKIDAGINHAINIVNEVDLDSLCALTVVLAILNIIPTTGNIKKGLDILNGLYSKLLTIDLPEGAAWIDNLNVVGAINLLGGNFDKLGNILSRSLNGYVCTGILDGTEDHKQAMGILEKNGLPKDYFVPNECLPDYLRLPLTNTRELNPELKPILDLYSKDKKLQDTAKNNFMNMWDSYEVLKKIKEWFNNIPIYFRINSVGKALAQTNAKRCYPEFPDLI